MDKRELMRNRLVQALQISDEEEGCNQEDDQASLTENERG